MNGPIFGEHSNWAFHGIDPASTCQESKKSFDCIEDYNILFSGKLILSTDGQNCAVSGAVNCPNDENQHCLADELMAAVRAEAETEGYGNLTLPVWFEHNTGAMAENGQVCIPKGWPIQELAGTQNPSGFPSPLCTANLGCVYGTQGLEALLKEDICTYGLTVSPALVVPDVPDMGESQVTGTLKVWSFNDFTLPAGDAIVLQCTDPDNEGVGCVDPGSVTYLPPNGVDTRTIVYTIPEPSMDPPLATYMPPIDVEGAWMSGSTTAQTRKTRAMAWVPFHFACSPIPTVIRRGDSGQVTCTITPRADYRSPDVRVGCTGDPVYGITCSESTVDVTGEQAVNVPVTVQVAATGANQDGAVVPVAFSAEDPQGIRRSTMGEVRIAVYRLTCPAEITIRRQEAATYTCTVEPVNGYAWTVNLTCTVPDGIGCTVTPSSVQLDGTNPVDVRVDIAYDPAQMPDGGQVRVTLTAADTVGNTQEALTDVYIGMFDLDCTPPSGYPVWPHPTNCGAAEVCRLHSRYRYAGTVSVGCSVTGPANCTIPQPNPTLVADGTLLPVATVQTTGNVGDTAWTDVTVQDDLNNQRTGTATVQRYAAQQLNVQCVPGQLSIPQQVADAGLCFWQGQNALEGNLSGAACRNVPAGMNCAVDPTDGTVDTTETTATHLHMNAGTASVGTYSIAVTGQGNAAVWWLSGCTPVQGSTAVDVTVQDPGVPHITVSCAPETLSTQPGHTAATLCTVTPQNGYTGAVTPSCFNLPDGAKCRFGVSTPVILNGAPVQIPVYVDTTDWLLAGTYRFLLVVLDERNQELRRAALVLDVAPVVAGATTAMRTETVRKRLSTNRAPECAGATAMPDVIASADGAMVPVTIAGVTDPDGDPIWVEVLDIRQDEPVGTGGAPDGNTVGPTVRAERADTGNGRVYRIAFVARDGRGGVCRGEVRVCVPNGAGGGCTDDGRRYDATLGSGVWTICGTVVGKQPFARWLEIRGVRMHWDAATVWTGMDATTVDMGTRVKVTAQPGPGGWHLATVEAAATCMADDGTGLSTGMMCGVVRSVDRTARMLRIGDVAMFWTETTQWTGTDGSSVARGDVVTVTTFWDGATARWVLETVTAGDACGP